VPKTNFKRLIAQSEQSRDWRTALVGQPVHLFQHSLPPAVRFGTCREHLIVLFNKLPRILQAPSSADATKPY
jgi:hypothetical protein